MKLRDPRLRVARYEVVSREDLDVRRRGTARAENEVGNVIAVHVAQCQEQAVDVMPPSVSDLNALTGVTPGASDSPR